MAELGDALSILFEERSKTAPMVPKELVRQVYEIEERVQFDIERPEAALKIKRAVDATITKEQMQENADGHAHQAG